MTPGEAEILAHMRATGVDRMQAIRYLRDRDILRERARALRARG